MAAPASSKTASSVAAPTSKTTSTVATPTSKTAASMMTMICFNALGAIRRRQYTGVAVAVAVEAVVDLAGAATFDVAAVFEAVVDLAGAATFDVAAVFEVAAAVVFEAAVDLPRHGALPNFLVIIRNRRETCLSVASWFLDPNNG